MSERERLIGVFPRRRVPPAGPRRGPVAIGTYVRYRFLRRTNDRKPITAAVTAIGER